MTRPFAHVLLRWLLCACALVPHLAGAAPAREEVVVWGLGLGPDSKGLEATIKEFERRNPRYKIRILSMGAGRMNPQKLMTSIVGNVPPDAIHQDRFTIGDWASRGAFQPLDDLMARDRETDPLCPRPEQYYPPTWEEASYGGKLYAIPMASDDRVLYYNKKRFRERAKELRAAGLDPGRAPRTWSEVLAYSKVLTDYNPDGKTLKRAGFLPNFGNSWLYMFAFQMNASFMSPDGKTCTLYSPEAEKALEFIVKGYDQVGGYENAKAFETGFQGGENDPFIIGKVAMKIDGDWILSGLARYAPNLDFGTAPAPVPDDRYTKRGAFANEKDTFVTWVGGFSYAIPKGARNAEGGWAWIKWATSADARLLEMSAQQEWEKRRGRFFVPRIQANIETNERAYKQFKPADPKFADAVRDHIDMMRYARIRPVTFVGQPLWDEHVRALENAALHKKTPAEALKDGQAVVQRELDAVLSAKNYPVIDMGVPGYIGFGAILIGVIAFVVWFRRQRLGPLARSEARWGYLFIAPWLIGFLVFTLGPMVASLFFSFTSYNVLSPARWVGAKNYSDLFAGDWVNVSKALYNTIYLGGIGVPLGVATGLAVALLLNSAVRGMRYYRTLFYMPAIVPTVASAVLWIWLLTSDPNKGLINSVWSNTVGAWFDVAPPGWLNAESWAKPSLILMGVWGAGSGMILWLAGLKGVPTQLYEAASIDGASPRGQFWAITLPQLSPIVFFNLVMGFIGALQEFDRVYVMKPAEGSAGPADSLLVPVYHLFVNGFNYFKMGYASAMAWVIFLIILAMTLVQFKLAPRWVHYEADKA
ncbi:MAG: extracellular solute-binding protein [Fimbriimonadaceae bacterium]|nr:extracellular solute-binding protein [Fimbriimonadaceae bacterium]